MFLERLDIFLINIPILDVPVHRKFVVVGSIISLCSQFFFLYFFLNVSLPKNFRIIGLLFF